MHTYFNEVALELHPGFQVLKSVSPVHLHVLGHREALQLLHLSRRRWRRRGRGRRGHRFLFSDVNSSTATRRLSDRVEWKAGRGANRVSLNYHHCPTDGRKDEADIFPRLIRPTGARWAARGVSRGLSSSDGFPNRPVLAELPSRVGRKRTSGRDTGADEGEGKEREGSAVPPDVHFGGGGKPIWRGPSAGKTAAIYLGRLSNSNPITSSVTRLSDRWH